MSATDTTGSLATLSRGLGYDFTDIALLRRALAHRSWCAEVVQPSNERLEFLLMRPCWSRRYRIDVTAICPKAAHDLKTSPEPRLEVAEEIALASGCSSQGVGAAGGRESAIRPTRSRPCRCGVLEAAWMGPGLVAAYHRRLECRRQLDAWPQTVLQAHPSLRLAPSTVDGRVPTTRRRSIPRAGVWDRSRRSRASRRSWPSATSRRRTMFWSPITVVPELP